MGDGDRGRERTFTVLGALGWIAERFGKEGFDSPRLDGELLLCAATGLDRVGLYLNHDRPLGTEERARLRELVTRRLAREPVAYILGKKEFWSLELAVDRRVLVPRRETEHLVEAVIAEIPAGGAHLCADIGTGSGAIAIAVKRERPEATVLAVDRSAAALEIARANASRHGVVIEFLEGDLIGPLRGRAPCDVIASNPPYVASGEIERAGADLAHEPRIALDGGADGLDVLRRIIAEAKEVLRPGGLLACEIGADQGAVVEELCRADSAYDEARVGKDLAGRDRILLARRRA